MNLTGGPVDFLIVFAGGVVVSFTPCAYPLLPITISSIAGANTNGTRGAGFFLSLLYVLGMALTYSALAVAAALSGKVFGSFQNTFAIMFAIACLVLFFALAMLDFVPIPSFQWKGAPRVEKARSKLSVFGMGLVSGFVVGPCTAPILGTLLLYIASRQNVLLGVCLMFTFALGFGISMILAGTFGGFLAAMPRSNVWMVWVKKFAGIGLLALSVYYFFRAGQLL